MSRLSTAVHETLKSECRHLGALELWEIMRNRGESISLATVYNSLNSLVASGDIHEIRGAGESAVYDARLDHHAHLHCTKCNALSDIELKRGLNALQREAEEMSGFCELESDITLRGICPKCQRA